MIELLAKAIRLGGFTIMADDAGFVHIANPFTIIL
jgi:hypothetical protein